MFGFLIFLSNLFQENRLLLLPWLIYNGIKLLFLTSIIFAFLVLVICLRDDDFEFDLNVSWLVFIVTYGELIECIFYKYKISNLNENINFTGIYLYIWVGILALYDQFNSMDFLNRFPNIRVITNRNNNFNQRVVV